jgi:hypothetical protein
VGCPSEVNYRRAMGIARELDMRPLQAHCHLVLEKLYRRATKRQEAQDHLTAATGCIAICDGGMANNLPHPL